MPRLIKNGLSNVDIERAKPGLHADGGGLYLQVLGSNGRSWIFRYTVNGITRHMGLGSARSVTLEDARNLAFQARRLLAVDQQDPLEMRRLRQSFGYAR